MRRFLFIVVLAATTLGLVGSPGWGITDGEADGAGHPNVGALIAEWNQPGVKEELCSGTLISPTVFLTAGHCTAFLEESGIPSDQIWVSFDADVDPVTTSTHLFSGRWFTDPDYNRRQSDPADMAVVVLDTAVTGITPARLPQAGQFDGMQKAGTLSRQRFTVVGYGDHEAHTGGGPPVFPFDGQRWRAVSTFRSLTGAWLHLSQNPATGDGGACHGDSGGPNFLGAGAAETDVVASLAITGDTMCRATNVTYRLDTLTARAFLGRYVTLP